MRAVITVVGKDRTGIIAKLSDTICKCNANILDISQNVMDEMFAMVMFVDISACNVDFTVFTELLKQDGYELGMKVHCMHEDIFNAMHRV